MTRTCIAGCCLLLALCAAELHAATRTFQMQGNWSLASNWQGGVKPVGGDDVVIAATCTVDENIAVYTFGTFTVNTGVNLMLQGYALAFSGAVTNNGQIHTENTSSSPLPSGKTWGNYVFFEATTAQTVPPGTYTCLKISSASGRRVVTPGGDITVTQELNVEGFTNANQVTFDMGSYVLAGTPNYTYVSGILRTACTANAPLPSGCRWYSINLGKQGRVEFYATSPQFLPGGTFDDDLLLSGGSAKTATGVVYSNGVLTLSTALLVINDSGVVVGNTGTIGAGAGIFSATNMIATDGGGSLTKRFSSSGTFLYPVGDITGTHEYSPATLAFTAATGSFNASVRVVNAKHPQNQSAASYIDRYWSIATAATAMLTANVTCTYRTADVTGPEDNMYCGQWKAAQWYTRNKADTAANQISATGVEPTGDFTGIQGATAGCAASVTALLQGPASGATGAMSTALNTAGLLPLAQPYNTAPWNYPGTESVTAIPSATVVDWVLLEVRATAAGSPVARRAAFLLSDGSIVDLAGSGAVAFPTLMPGNYFLVVRHRNHLAIMTAAAIALSATSAPYDFTTAQAKAYGTDPMVGLAAGQAPFALWAGDATANGQLRYSGTGNDPAAILARIGSSDITAVVTGYFGEDTGMNGVVQYSGAGNDRAVILRNVGGVSPAGTRSTQVP
jgi:hypothetical protein